jgi:DNA helicase-4
MARVEISRALRILSDLIGIDEKNGPQIESKSEEGIPLKDTLSVKNLGSIKQNKQKQSSKSKIQKKSSHKPIPVAEIEEITPEIKKDQQSDEEKRVAVIANQILSDLNQRQREAVLSENKRLLVLAGAGAGKTKTLIQKIMLLLSTGKAEPSDILAITFTKDAANQMIDRLIEMAEPDGEYSKLIRSKDFSNEEKAEHRYRYKKKYPWISNLTVKTFHSFCFKVLREHGETEFDNRFKILEDKNYNEDFTSKNASTERIDQILHKLVLKQCDDIDYLLKFKRYILENFVEYGIKKGYYKYRNYDFSKPYITLKGESVRSKSERYIADWFYRHNIAYEYEKEINLGDFNFRPDFYLPSADIYIEHVSNYSKGMEDKEKQFSNAGKRLFKTYETRTRDISEFHKDIETIVLPYLENGLTSIESLKAEEEFKEYLSEFESFIKDYLIRAIDKIKVEDLNVDEICERGKKSKFDRVKIFYELFNPIYKDYLVYCTRKSYLDFNDLILKTISLFDKQPSICDLYRKTFKYILVDEFQDVNTLQVKLIKQLITKNTRLFCVGDDWQSIYGWRGSEVEYIVDFKEHFREDWIEPEIITLDVNYRCSSPIVNASNEVIRRNQYQLPKDIRAFQEGGRNIALHLAKMEEEDGVDEVAKMIKNLNQSGFSAEDILVLYRSHKNFEPYKERLKGLKFRRHTVHTAKGLEAKAVFILGLKNGMYGFPNTSGSNMIFQIIKQSDYEKELEEERRLFYVALTRSKEFLFLVSEVGNESMFLKELPGTFVDRTNFLTLNIKEPFHDGSCRSCGENNKNSFKYCPYCGSSTSIQIPTVTDEKNDQIIDIKRGEPVKQVSDSELKKKLKEYRLAQAREQNIPPYCIFHDSVLYQLVDKRPNSLADLRLIRGIRDRKITKYGKDILDIINSKENC